MHGNYFNGCQSKTRNLVTTPLIYFRQKALLVRLSYNSGAILMMVMPLLLADGKKFANSVNNNPVLTATTIAKSGKPG
jgi:hypothetical protein